MISRLLIAAIIVWLFGYPIFLDHVDLSGSLYAKPIFHIGITAMLIFTILVREVWRTMILQDSSRPIGMNALMIVIIALIGTAILYSIATRGYDVLIAKTGSQMTAAVVMAGFVIALVYLWIRFAQEPMRRMLFRSKNETE